MPMQLDEIDYAIIKTLEKDGRKSFRQIAKDTGISTPTAKARYDRLINIGFLKSISPVLDFTKIEPSSDTIKLQEESTYKDGDHKPALGKNTKIKLICDFCEGQIAGAAHIFRFANFERFFCCTQCRAAYKEKYRGRIESLTKRHQE
jgi:Lrp/AsnC family leucine-responsive transcriptional regulator